MRKRVTQELGRFHCLHALENRKRVPGANRNPRPCVVRPDTNGSEARWAQVLNGIGRAKETKRGETDSEKS